MCGIMGYIGEQDVITVIVDGLKRLEYRGYDSAGIAYLKNGEIQVRRSEGKLRNLESLLRGESTDSGIGIGHTRWATHGRPSEENAHPHRSGDTVIVHNGIIENYLPLKKALIEEGVAFTSETDTEVMAHLIEKSLKEQGGDLVKAVRSALKKVSGAFALGIMNKNDPDKIIAVKMASPLVLGLGSGENFLASDIPAILNHTRKVIFLDDGEMAVLTREGVTVTTLEGKPVDKEIQHITWSAVMAEKGGYKHFMQKEIFEQPRAILDTFRGRIGRESGEVFFEQFDISPEEAKKIRKIVMIACGTSYHAALVGKFMVEEMARIPVEVDIASEFRYRDPLVDEKTLLVCISQSGETADTLAALREAKAKGARTLGICNVLGSSITREAEWVLYTHAGPEIGVASTKAFTTQLVALYLFSLYLARTLDRISAADSVSLMEDLTHLPHQVEKVLEAEDTIRNLAGIYADRTDFLYLGRGIHYPIALEGALKLKEISYIHAEGYPAGEMKHGPIALIDEKMPVVCLLPRDKVFEKALGNIEEVKARSGIVIALVTGKEPEVRQKADHVIEVPNSNHYLTPVLMTVPLQLLAYHIAVLRGTDVDQPRNLAKSVTVE
ncbi:MAG: glutamine--fructose-6-phosphate transaminase (isomerizing) [Nitrospirae bacterium CG17_big_fil_post_rev_8_21_14_2_50_50_9]|nr:MAG: glutamine--fructose-6-phosphate aminotransferase [Nitrospirae bacterium CG2_30_53_67]PIV85639.1 MAG: glutamine--fructose-6-phosphate transaminase (isomerizing) [Nitrospirae bacterium CG17_big_fil_post_rev_8_21_14_2_50_50_9]